MEIEEAQQILEMDSLLEKLHKIVAILTRESEVLELGQKIQNEAREEIEKVQRDYFLREQLKAIHRELGETDEQTSKWKNSARKLMRLNYHRRLKKLPREIGSPFTPPTAISRVWCYPYLPGLVGFTPLDKYQQLITWISLMPVKYLSKDHYGLRM